MYEYKFKLSKVIDGDTVDGIIDLGFGIFLSERVRLLGIDAPETRMQSSITDYDERLAEKKRGLAAKSRLLELLKVGAKQPEGLIIKTELLKRGKYGRVLGDIKYVYARDLHNYKEGAKPWIGYRSISKQLLEEGLVKLYNK